MKKSLTIFLLLFSLTIILSCFPGDKDRNMNGNGTEAGTGSIGISFENSLTGIVDITGYVITGIGPGGAVFETTITENSATIENLASGDWIVNTSALNGENITIGTGSKTATVQKGGISHITISVFPIEGYGSLDLTAQWDQGKRGDREVKVWLIPVTGSPIELIFTHTGENTGNYLATNIPTGLYTLIIKLFDNDQPVTGRAGIVRIVDGQTTSGTFEVTGSKNPKKNIKINIDLQMDESIPVTLTEQDDGMSSGGSMTLKASVPSDAGNVTFYWYINGEFKATGENYKFDHGHSQRMHLLDVIVYSANGSRAGSASHEFRKNCSKSSYKVSYNSNGAISGSVPVDDASYKEGQSFTVSGNTGNLVKTGYTFAGWNTAADGSGTAYSEGQSFIMGSENVVLYAVWTTGFITTWKTDNPGVSEDNQVTIPVYEDETYDYSVDWGDGSADTNIAGPITHTYASPGTYTINISGTFPGIFFNNTGDREKILAIEKWGNIKWRRMESAFYGCIYLRYNAADAPDLSGVNNTSRMFCYAIYFNGDLSGWDVSNVTDMRGMFEDARSFNGDLSGWNVSSVTKMSTMFLRAYVFSSYNLNGWDVSSVTDMSYMFYYARSFNGDVSGWDVSSVTNMRSMFGFAGSFNGDVSGWDVGSVTDMYGMFYNASSFSNHDLSGWDVTKVVNIVDHWNFSTGWGTGNTGPNWVN